MSVGVINLRIASCTNPNQAIQLQSPRYAVVQGNVPKLAIKHVDFVNDVNFKGTKENHHLKFKYNEEIGRSVAYIVDNASGETVKVLPSETQLDHWVRIKRLMGLNLDLRA